MTHHDQRILIFTGGTLGAWALDEIRPGDLLIGADRGALFLVQHGLRPDLALGDFDSVSPEQAEWIRTNSSQFLSCDPVMKDQTDTDMAFDEALQRNPQEIILLGALGTRFDHSLANVHLLCKAIDRGIRCRIVDEHNELILVDKQANILKSRYEHVSLLPLTMEVTGITLRGFQYPLYDATLRIGNSLGISNVLEEAEGIVMIKTGLLLVIQSRD